MQALWLCTPVHQYTHALEASLTHRSKCKAIAEINNKTPGSGKMQSSNGLSVPRVKNAAFNNQPDLIACMSSRLLGSQSLLNVPGLLPPRQQPAASPRSRVPAQPNPDCARSEVARSQLTDADCRVGPASSRPVRPWVPPAAPLGVPPAALGWLCCCAVPTRHRCRPVRRLKPAWHESCVAARPERVSHTKYRRGLGGEGSSCLWTRTRSGVRRALSSALAIWQQWFTCKIFSHLEESQNCNLTAYINAALILTDNTWSNHLASGRMYHTLT